ncbi:MAG: hypothetical protein KF849_13315 [Rhizobiaceae bacterium]|nr:hypothetical protein [Rhizobiaceae bacterium]
MRAKPDYKTIVENVVLAEFAAGGYIANKHLVGKLGKVPGWVVRRYHDDAVAAIPDRQQVEQAYARFLEIACRGELCDELISAASSARLTAQRVADVIGEETETVAKRARALGFKLARSEHKFAAASRLTTECARMLAATGLSKARQQKIAGVPSQTFAQRLVAAAATEDEPDELANDVDEHLQGQGLQNEETVASVTASGRCPDEPVLLGPIAVRGFGNEAINLAARKILLRDGRDPDQLVVGVYHHDEGDGGRLECDRIELVDGRPTPHVASFRLEAERIASILALVEASSAPAPA